MKLVLEWIAALAAVASAVVAVRACTGAEELNRETMYISTVNTRITTCSALSEFHRGSPSAPSQITDQRKRVSTRSERSDSAANLARALSLCLVDYKSVAQLRQCVGQADASDSHKVHDMLAPDTNGNPPMGADNLVC